MNHYYILNTTAVLLLNTVTKTNHTISSYSDLDVILSYHYYS